MTEANFKTYTTKELADLAGISTRTLRYYDQIGLLVPIRAQNGYRVYRPTDVKRLQYILMMRSCGVGLDSIELALDQPGFSLSSMLKEHLTFLCRQKDELNKMITTTNAALAGLENFEIMNDAEKFEELKKRSVADFEETYGEEARQLYGNEAIDESNERILTMSKRAWGLKEELEQRIKDGLIAAMATKDPLSPKSKQVAGMHAQWIKIHWGENAYTPEAHVALAESYLSDQRFIDYYDDACGKGATEFLRDIIKANV